MPRRNNLNGLPHNITKSYFSTLRYYNGGYMADWLLNAARQLKINEASLNLLDGTFSPKELNIRPLVINAENLKEIILKELIGNGFELGFIKEAKIDFQFPNLNSSAKKFYCVPYLIDIEDRRYEIGRIVEEAFESPFDAFSDKNLYPTSKLSDLFSKIKNLFN